MRSFIINKFVHVSGCQALVVIYSGFRTQLDFKKGKNGGEIKLNNSGRQKKGKKTKQKQTPSRKSFFLS